MTLVTGLTALQLWALAAGTGIRVRAEAAPVDEPGAAGSPPPRRPPTLRGRRRLRVCAVPAAVAPALRGAMAMGRMLPPGAPLSYIGVSNNLKTPGSLSFYGGDWRSAQRRTHTMQRNTHGGLQYKTRAEAC